MRWIANTHPEIKIITMSKNRFSKTVRYFMRKINGQPLSFDPYHWVNSLDDRDFRLLSALSVGSDDAESEDPQSVEALNALTDAICLKLGIQKNEEHFSNFQFIIDSAALTKRGVFKSEYIAFDPQAS